MKQYFTLFVLCLVLVACSNNGRWSDYAEEVIEAEPDMKEIFRQAGFIEGTIPPYIGQNQKEKNLISQNNAYFEAMFKGDIHIIKKYIYIDAFTYYAKNMYPTEDVDAVVDDMVKSASEKIVLIKKNYSDKYTNFISKIGEFYSYKNYILCKFDFVGQIEIEDNDEILVFHTPSEENIAISSDYGKTWKFTALTNYISKVLSEKFPEEIVNSVLY